MSESYADIFKSLCRPLDPLPTGQPTVLAELPGIRAVMFDLYGTLFISGSGDVGSASDESHEAALAEAFGAIGLKPLGPIHRALEYRVQMIKFQHAEARAAGVNYPEVDIVEVWRGVMARLGNDGVVPPKTLGQTDLERLAVHYEARSNPVWPMPGVKECLRCLTKKGLTLGIISNAQFFTLELFVALLGGGPEDWGFSPELLYYSYQHGRAKPGLDLHRMAAEALLRREIEPSQVVYVGNDMINDLLPASQIGFRTALFAGDSRSLRLRQGDPRLDGITADLVLGSLSELNECV